MSNKVQEFLNENFGQVRCFKNEKNNIWFVAKDICDILGIKNVSLAVNGNPTRNDNGVGDKNKGVYNVNTLGGNQDLLCISEQGLYKIIFKSRKPFAEEFQDWICEIVIPAIRKDGAYVNNEEKLQSNEMSEDEFILQAMTILQNKVQRYKEENEVLKGLTDSFLNGKDYYDIGTYSKIIQAKDKDTNKVLGRNKLFEWLKENKILMSNNIPFQNMMGYFKVISVENKYNGHVNNKTLITPKGIKYIYKRLLKDNKVIEKDFETIISELRQQPA